MNNLVVNPMGKAVAESAGARQSQSRELAETQAKYLMAEQFPRHIVQAMDRILNAFTRASLAERAQYSYAKGGTDIVGPSIRAAEAIAQQWGNMEFGFRETSRGVGEKGNFSEVEAYCIDLQSRNSARRQFIVPHWRDTRQGGYAIKDERDIYELISNQAQRRVRACILAMIPGDVVDTAMDQAEVTLRTTADTSMPAMLKMIEGFSAFDVTRDQIEKRIQRRIDSIRPAQVIMLRRIYASLRDDMSEPGDWFEVEGAAPAGAAEATASDGVVATYPQAEFEKALIRWHKAIADKKMTFEQVVSTAETKYPLTPEQKKIIKDGAKEAVQPVAAVVTPAAKPAAAAKPGAYLVTYEALKAKLERAEDVELLDIAADLIKEVVDAEERADLDGIYQARRTAFTQ